MSQKNQRQKIMAQAVQTNFSEILSTQYHLNIHSIELAESEILEKHRPHELSTAEHLRVFKILQGTTEFFELFCIKCRETVASFE